MGEYVLEVSRLRKKYKSQEVLKDVSFRLEPGTATALIGPCGAGKTTLLRILAGMAFSDEGDVSLFGSTGEEELRRARRQVGFLVDAPFGKVSFNVEKNLLLRARLYGKPDRRDIRQIMKRLNINEKQIGGWKLSKMLPDQVGRYALAAALVNKPRLLVLDEPLVKIDTEDLDTVCGLLNELREEGTTMLLSGRTAARLRLVCSRALLLKEGVLTGPMPIDEAAEQTEEEAEKSAG
jgi:ABC-2 type transport system ATP-binding protein